VEGCGGEGDAVGGQEAELRVAGVRCDGVERGRGGRGGSGEAGGAAGPGVVG
jgi:hypothetical protein